MIENHGFLQYNLNHVASAILSECGCFLTTDKLELMTPVDFIRRLEDQI